MTAGKPKGVLTDTVIAGIKPETVIEKTGRSWEEWDSILNDFDVASNCSPAASRHLRENYDVSMWWSNTILTRYKQLNGIG
jgi:hypothetical protein